MAEMPAAAGVLLKDGTVVVGDGHCLAHDMICDCAGLDIDSELFRLQLWEGKVLIELWIEEERATTESPLEAKIKAAEEQYGMTLDEMRSRVSHATARFVPGWRIICGLWTDFANLTEV